MKPPHTRFHVIAALWIVTSLLACTLLTPAAPASPPSPSTPPEAVPTEPPNYPTLQPPNQPAAHGNPPASAAQATSSASTSIRISPAWCTPRAMCRV